MDDDLINGTNLDWFLIGIVKLEFLDLGIEF